tara:strand:- start:103047 stop:103832 length:786 start_codon:yes stop_codon:yes gene_type:complete
MVIQVEWIYAQDNSVDVFHERVESGVVVYAENKKLYPVTLQLNLEIENLAPDRAIPLTIVIPSNETLEVLQLTISNKAKAWDYRSKYQYYMGDVNANHNDAFAYRLPLKRGESFRLIQGYGGTFSHQGDLQHSLDFEMEKGTEVYAARDGLVVQLEEDNTRGGPSEEMMDLANYVTIMHSDGTFADYTHLSPQGVVVENGQWVRAGQLIGYSGNTGFSTGPHLHFVVKKTKRGGGFLSIPIKFTTKAGIRSLEEGQTYTGY